MYNAFISYRKSSSVNADFIRKSIADTSAFTENDIFLDKHSIGPELFDSKIRTAISSSKCIILLVTKDCFKAKTDGNEDWFIKEIKTALSLGIKIIPVLFDQIKSLSDNSIVEDLRGNFDANEIEILTKSQSIPYSTDFPEASIEKLVSFVESANKTSNVFQKLWNVLKGLAIILIILVTFVVAFFGLGVLWGYFSSSSEMDEVLADNTIIEGTTLHFEYDGWDATYDLTNDTILIDITDYSHSPKIGNVDLALASFTFTGAKAILDKNISYIKYVKMLRGGSKPAKIALVCASAAACVGAFCGFSQGSNFGKSKRQEETALKLYPKLQNRSTWKPLMKDNIFLNQKYVWWELAKAPNGITIGMPKDSTCVAFKSGIVSPMVLLRYNNWEIGKNNYLGISEEINDAKDKEKEFVLLNMEDLSVHEYHLPQGIVGIMFQPGDGNQGRYEIAIDKYNTWKYHSRNL